MNTIGEKMKKQVLLKIPQELKEKLQKKSKEKGLSLNSYITTILWEKLEK